MWDKRIAITGIGPLTSIGLDKSTLWRSLIKGKTGLTKERVKLKKELIEEFFVHRIKNFDINKFDINKNILKDIALWKGEEGPIDLYLLMAAAKLALDDARIDNNVIKRDKVGLILTHENPGLDQFYWQIINEFVSNKGTKELRNAKDFFFKKFYNKFEKRGYELQTFMFLFHIAKALNINGYSLFLNNACASGLYALEAGADAIRSGKCLAVVIVAADYGSIFKNLWFKKAGVYPKDGKTKPFSKNADGFVSGDAGAGVVLEGIESAKKRKAYIYAEYAGSSFSIDPWKVTIPNMLSQNYQNVILNAIQNSDCKKSEIDLVVPHGVGMSVTDAFEAKAITDVFGENTDKPLITAFKPYIGHCLGASALIETIILLLAIQNELIPPTLNCAELNPKLHLKLVTKPTRLKLNNVLQMACGFAGFNGAVVFRKI